MELLTETGFGLTEALIVLFILILVVGGKRLPGLGKGLGEGIGRFLAAMLSESSCEQCGEALRGTELRCPVCRRLTVTGSSTLLSLAAAALIYGLVLLEHFETNLMLGLP